ncbi:hypothetical protein C0J52_02984 [Blattella germanica]|nr:hypothetical protein C0J52_02984 [Blattella germanica]
MENFIGSCKKVRIVSLNIFIQLCIFLETFIVRICIFHRSDTQHVQASANFSVLFIFRL